MFWAMIVGFAALIGMRVLPALNEYFTIKRTVNKIATEGTTVPEIRAAFERQKTSSTRSRRSRSKDLVITKDNDKIVVASPTTRKSSCEAGVTCSSSSKADRTRLGFALEPAYRFRPFNRQAWIPVSSPCSSASATASPTRRSSSAH